MTQRERESFEEQQGVYYKSRVAKMLDLWMLKRSEDFIHGDATLFILLSYFMKYLRQQASLKKKMNVSFQKVRESFSSLAMLHKEHNCEKSS